MHGQNGADRFALRPFQNGFNGRRDKIEGGRIDVGQHRRGPGAQNRADRGEKAEGRGDDGLAGPNPGGGQRQPQRVGARGAAKGVGHAQLPGRGLLKGGDRLAENELLRLKHMAERLQQFLLERLVLALQVEHGNRAL